ncbi:uncharacterized protein LOC143147637 [Ptiloglossa arizonensis]|uniref:uncharacterized protein LOC143147637 n=1 Tax=Ptiloglossa arizonensis TaxID=3350558 RepID=UPI003FA129AE
MSRLLCDAVEGEWHCSNKTLCKTFEREIPFLMFSEADRLDPNQLSRVEFCRIFPTSSGDSQCETRYACDNRFRTTVALMLINPQTLEPKSPENLYRCIRGNECKRTIRFTLYTGTPVRSSIPAVAFERSTETDDGRLVKFFGVLENVQNPLSKLCYLSFEVRPVRHAGKLQNFNRYR